MKNKVVYSIHTILLITILFSIEARCQSTYHQVYSILKTKCSPACHTPSMPHGLLLLSDSPNVVYTNLVNHDPTNPNALARGDKRIYPGNPHRSFLFHKVNNGLDADLTLAVADGGSMPQFPNAPLSTYDVELIRQWIQMGAPKTGMVVDTALITKYYSGNGIDGAQALHPVPTDTNAFQIHIGKVFLPPSSEMEYYLKYKLNLKDTVQVNKIETVIPIATHHINISKFDSGLDSNYADGLRVLDTITGIGYSIKHNKLVNAWQSSYSYQLPAGTAYLWEKKTVLDIAHHIINTHPDSILSFDSYINVYTQPKQTPANIMYTRVIKDTAITIPNTSTNVNFSSSYFDTTATNMWNVWLLSSLTNQYCIDFDIYKRNIDGSLGTQVFEGWYNPDYTFNQGYYDNDHPPIEKFTPLMNIDPRAGLTQKTIYNNTGSSSVSFGYTSNDETMMYYMQYTLGAPLVGINNLNSTVNTLLVFPNPATGSFTISSTQKIDAITISNLLGETVMQTNPNTETTQLNISKAGVYFVYVTVGNKTSTQKIIIAN